jgi:hypothetical protein
MGQNREEQSREDRNHRNDDEQLDQRKGGLWRWTIPFHGS